MIAAAAIEAAAAAVGTAVTPGLAPNATIAGRVDLTSSVAHIRVRPDDGAPVFEPGQYLALGLPVDGRVIPPEAIRSEQYWPPGGPVRA